MRNTVLYQYLKCAETVI